METTEEKIIINNSFAKGLQDGIPIGLGYLSVAFTFGMMAVTQGLPAWSAVLISMTNLTSAGQFAGLDLIVLGAPFVEMALTQLIINLRYALMSLSLSQKLEDSVTTLERCLIAFGNTDEIFAVSSGQPGKLGKWYMFGLMVMPYIGWSGGTLIGAAASTILPEFIRSGKKEKIGQSRVDLCSGTKLYFYLCANPEPGINGFYHYHLHYCRVGLWRLVLSHQ